jgi:hypothetical protein
MPCQYQCGVSLPKNSLTIHEQNLCENAPVVCPYKSVNCQITVTRKNLDQHLIDYSQKHVEMTCQFTSMIRLYSLILLLFLFFCRVTLHFSLHRSITLYLLLIPLDSLSTGMAAMKKEFDDFTAKWRDEKSVLHDSD